MAWERRGESHYYYRKRREGQRVESEYVGRGSSASLLAALDRHDREERLRAQVRMQIEEAELRGVKIELANLAELTSNLVRATLLISGYHPHKGQWRKKRYG